MSSVDLDVVRTIVGALSLLIGACQVGAVAVPPADAAAVDLAGRGEYLVAIMGCGDCHPPMKLGPNGPEPDDTRLLSGHPEELALGAPPTLGEGGWMWAGAATNTAFAGPWGVTYAVNLTPDEESGMGIWTEEMFIAALRKGEHFGNGRPIMPPMPWPAYSHATDDDLKAVFAYLRSLKPIVNHVPEYRPSAAP